MCRKRHEAVGLPVVRRELPVPVAPESVGELQALLSPLGAIVTGPPPFVSFLRSILRYIVERGARRCPAGRK